MQSLAIQLHFSRLRTRLRLDNLTPIVFPSVDLNSNDHIFLNKVFLHKPQFISVCQLHSKADHSEPSLLSLNRKCNNQKLSICSSRNFHTTPTHYQKQLSKHVRKDTNFSDKAKEATKTTYYSVVVLIGFGITGILAYTIFKELFSSFSPQSVYSDAVEKCTSHPRVQDMLGGDSLKCYGEETRRGRRQHVSHVTYEVEGQRGMRIMFHLKGSRRTGTAQLDVRDSPSGWYYRYLYVQLDQYPNEVIVIQDNRATTNDSYSGGSDSGSFSSYKPDGELKPIFPA